MDEQADLFSDAGPAGLSVSDDVIDRAMEAALVERFHELPFVEFQFHGYLGKRRVVSYGWRYDYAESRALETLPIPPFLLELRAIAAAFAGLSADSLEQALVTEYGPGLAIGWHRDKPVFGDVVGISLLTPCRFRLRRRAGTRWQRFAFTARPRSAYVLRGAARTEWEHSIPPVVALRYSVTFRQRVSPSARTSSPPRA